MQRIYQQIVVPQIQRKEFIPHTFPTIPRMQSSKPGFLPLVFPNPPSPHPSPRLYYTKAPEKDRD